MNYDEKLEAAIAWLGPKWVLHPERRVPKGNYIQAVLKCDVEKTFKRIRKELGNVEANTIHDGNV